MKAKSVKEVGFVEICTQKRRERLAHHFLYKIDKSVDWDKLRKTITKRYKKNKNAIGNPAYDPILLFKILLLEGDVEWTTMKEAFYKCENLELSPKAGKPDLRKVEDALSMFSGCSKFNTPIGFWDVSNLRYMFSMFDDTPFNQDLSAWKLDNVEWLSFNDTGIPPETLAKFISIWASNPKLRKKGELVVCGEEYMNSDAIRKAFRKWRQMRPRWDISFGERGDFDE